MLKAYPPSVRVIARGNSTQGNPLFAEGGLFRPREDRNDTDSSEDYSLLIAFRYPS